MGRRPAAGRSDRVRRGREGKGQCRKQAIKEGEDAMEVMESNDWEGKERLQQKEGRRGGKRGRQRRSGRTRRRAKRRRTDEEGKKGCPREGTGGVATRVGVGGADQLVQPAHELGNGNAVPKVGLLHPGHLCLVLDGFGHGNRGRYLYDWGCAALHRSRGAVSSRAEGLA